MEEIHHNVTGDHICLGSKFTTDWEQWDQASLLAKLSSVSSYLNSEECFLSSSQPLQTLLGSNQNFRKLQRNQDDELC